MLYKGDNSVVREVGPKDNTFAQSDGAHIYGGGGSRINYYEFSVRLTGQVYRWG